MADLYFSADPEYLDRLDLVNPDDYNGSNDLFVNKSVDDRVLVAANICMEMFSAFLCVLLSTDLNG